MDAFKELLKWIFDIGMYLNIVALLPQPIKILRSESAKGVSVWMWWIFFIFQVAISLHGKLNLGSASMFLGMGGSAIVSLATLVLCSIYKKN